VLSAHSSTSCCRDGSTLTTCAFAVSEMSILTPHSAVSRSLLIGALRSYSLVKPTFYYALGLLYDRLTILALPRDILLGYILNRSVSQPTSSSHRGTVLTPAGAHCRNQLPNGRSGRCGLGSRCPSWASSMTLIMKLKSPTALAAAVGSNQDLVLGPILQA
jgi:hypothetical protein